MISAQGGRNLTIAVTLARRRPDGNLLTGSPAQKLRVVAVNVSTGMEPAWNPSGFRELVSCESGISEIN